MYSYRCTERMQILRTKYLKHLKQNKFVSNIEEPVLKINFNRIGEYLIFPKAHFFIC